MDELRTFELGPQHTTQALVLGRAGTLCALNGPIWVTVEGKPEDIWLQAGERIEAGAGQRIWLSAEYEGARFTVLTRGVFVGLGLRELLAAMLGRLLTRASSIRSA